MTMNRWIGTTMACVLAYVCAIDAAWSADATTASPQPNATVGSDGAPPVKSAKVDATPKPAGNPSKTPPATAKTDEDKNRDFKPSEDISEDMSVAYPSDI